MSKKQDKEPEEREEQAEAGGEKAKAAGDGEAGGGEKAKAAGDGEAGGEETKAAGDGSGGEDGGALEALIGTIDGEVAAAPDSAPGQAGEEEPTPGEETARQYLLFSLAGTECAVALDHLLELAELPRLTLVPNVPRWVQGVTNLRGDILAVLDLPIFFDMGTTARRETTRMLVVRSHDHTVMAGLLADAVHGIALVSQDHMRPPEAPLEDKIAPYLAGVVDHDERLVSVLDLDKLLMAPEFRQLEAM